MNDSLVCHSISKGVNISGLSFTTNVRFWLLEKFLSFAFVNRFT